MADDAKTAYIQDRQVEEPTPQPQPELSDAELVAQARERLIASGLLGPDGQPPAPAGDKAVAPTGPDPNLIQPQDLAPKTMPTREDIKRSSLRGPGKAIANLADFGLRGVDGALEYLGVDPATIPSGTIVGDAFDNTFGKPQTTAGQVTQELTGLITPMKMLMAPVQYASKAQQLTRAILGGAAVTTALTSDKDPGLANLAQSQEGAHWYKNWATELLALEKDDSGFEKFLKRLTENLVVNGATEAAAAAVGKGIAAVRTLKADKGAIQDSAIEAGLKTDPGVEDALDGMTAAKTEKDALEAAQPSVAPKAPPAAPAAAPVAPVAPKAPPAAPVKLPKELAGAKPRAGVGAKQFKLAFESDVDKAAYIAAQATRSKADAQYVAWGQQVTGMTEAEFRAHGVKVRAAIKELTRTAEAGDLSVSALWKDTHPRVGGPEPVVPKGVAPEATAATPETAPKAPSEPPSATPASTTGATKEPATGASAAPEGPAVPKDVAGSIEAKKAQATAETQARTEQFVRSMELSTNDPSVLKAYKETAQAAGHDFTPEQMARIDAAIAARTEAAKPIPKDHPFGGHLLITKGQLNGIKSAFLAGDFHGATGLLGEIIGDTTNFNKIVASGDITDLLAGLMHEFGKDDKSYHLLVSRSREATFATAEEELQALAKVHGTDANSIRLALEKQFPGRDLTKTLTAYRMLEVGLADQCNKLAEVIGKHGDDAIAAETELSRMLALTSIVNDRRAGLVSDIGRALNSLQKVADVPNGVVLRQAARQARDMGLEAFINSTGGGRKNIQRLAEMIRSGGTPEAKAKMVKKASTMLAGTMGDALYAYVIHNTLSGPLTALKNVSSSTFYQGVWKPFSNLSGAVGHDLAAALRGEDATMLRKEWRRVRATYATARKVISQDSMVRRNMAQAWETGQRVTTPGGAFMEHLGAAGQKVTRLGEGNMARATELAKIARAGGQFQVPFGPRVNLGAALVGQNRLNKFATALDASAATKRLWSPMSKDPAQEMAKRYGFAAKMIDYAGRANSWPMHALATGDEFNASIARSGALEAETFDSVQSLKLGAQDSEKYIRDVIENIDTIPMLESKAADGLLSPEELKRLSIMQDVSAKADDYVREMTFTENPGKITQLFAHARSLPIGTRWMMFFVRTPGNITRAGIKESPVGRTLLTASALGKGDIPAAAEQAGRAAFATGVAYAGFEAVVNGNMTGGGPLDPEAYAAWIAEGNAPYVLRLPLPGDNDVVLNYGSYADPVALPLQVMADLAETSEYMDDDTHRAFADEFMDRMMKLLESKSYLSSVTDTLDLITGRGSRENAMIRIMKNFVPQSRLLASLRTNGLPVPKGVGHAIFGSPDASDAAMTLQQFIDGRSTKGIVDKGQGVRVNDKGELVNIHDGIIDSPEVVHFVSDVAEDLPPGFAESWLEFHARVLGVKAQHGKYVQRDQLGEKRILPIGYGPQNATGLLSEKGNDPVYQELIDVGMDKSVNDTFGQYMGTPLTPEQQDYFQRRYRKPTKDSLTAYELFKREMARDSYKKLGETVGNIKGGRAKMLQAVHDARMGEAQAAMWKKFPEIRAIFTNAMKTKEQMMTKEGSDAFAAEHAARAPLLIKAFKEAANGDN